MTEPAIQVEPRMLGRDAAMAFCGFDSVRRFNRAMASRGIAGALHRKRGYMTEAYPLQWPPGWPRTPAHRRQRSRFEPRGLHAEAQYIRWELERLGARHPVISTNVAVRRDGRPYAQQRHIEDPGVAVYFQLSGRQQCIPCDRWATVQENARAIWKSIEALRGLERWGAKSFVDAAFSGFQALPAPDGSAENWWEVLGCRPDAPMEERKAAWRKRVRETHPDNGGDAAAFARVQNAWERAQKEAAA